MLLVSEHASGASGVTLNSGPTPWIITPSMEPSRLLCISNRHILRSAVRIFALIFLAQFHGSMHSVTLNCRVLIQLDWLLL